MKKTIKIKQNNIEVDAQIDVRTLIATVTLFGVAYKFSMREYEIVGEEDV